MYPLNIDSINVFFFIVFAFPQTIIIMCTWKMDVLIEQQCGCVKIKPAHHYQKQIKLPKCKISLCEICLILKILLCFVTSSCLSPALG